MHVLERSAPARQNPRIAGAVRERILAAATRLIAEHGIDGMTMRRIADATGLSTGTVNYHFRNKRGIVIAALEHVYRVPNDAGAASGSTADRLRALTRGFILDSDGRRDWWRFWIDYSAHASRDTELQQHQSARFDAQLRFFERVISDERGESTAANHASDSAATLLSLAYGLAVRQTFQPGTETVDEARRTLDAEIRRIAGRG